MKSIIACGKEYRIIRLLGHGKGGYSYLAETKAGPAVVKQIHHEPCDYYTFGNKIEAEKRDYDRLRKAGIRIPALIAIDEEKEIVVKEYIAGDTIFELVRDGGSAEPYLDQVREMAAVTRRVMAPDFFLPESKCGKAGTCRFRLADLPPKAHLRFTVTPIECFGKKGAPITSGLFET